MDLTLSRTNRVCCYHPTYSNTLLYSESSGDEAAGDPVLGAASRWSPLEPADAAAADLGWRLTEDDTEPSIDGARDKSLHCMVSIYLGLGANRKLEIQILARLLLIQHDAGAECELDPNADGLTLNGVLECRWRVTVRLRHRGWGTCGRLLGLHTPPPPKGARGPALFRTDSVKAVPFATNRYIKYMV